MNKFKKKNIFLVILGITALGIIIFLFTIKPANLSLPSVNSYVDCVNAGYPIQESNPPKCFTPDGKTFTGSIISSNNKVTISATTIALEADISCKTDSDCILINEDNGYNCCYDNFCKTNDMS